MSERTLVPIFVFWAFLTIITPTLVLLSENSKLDYDLHGNTTEGVKDRRMMMGYTENYITKRPNHTTKTTPSVTVVEAEELASAPAIAPSASLGTPGANLTTSYHNHTLRSNKTDDGITLGSPTKRIRQTRIPSMSS